jgi:hypothetical protein
MLNVGVWYSFCCRRRIDGIDQEMIHVNHLMKSIQLDIQLRMLSESKTKDQKNESTMGALEIVQDMLECD